MELANAGVTFLSLDPGDMDTPMHGAAVPDGDRSELKRPETAAAELVDAIGNQLAVMNSARNTARNSPQAFEEVHG
jgi:hypothetical protein